VVVVSESYPRSFNRNCGFKFEASWIQEEGCRKVIEDAWGMSGSNVVCLKENIRVVTASIKEWSINVLGDLEKRLKKG